MSGCRDILESLNGCCNVTFKTLTSPLKEGAKILKMETDWCGENKKNTIDPSAKILVCGWSLIYCGIWGVPIAITGAFAGATELILNPSCQGSPRDTHMDDGSAYSGYNPPIYDPVKNTVTPSSERTRLLENVPSELEMGGNKRRV